MEKKLAKVNQSVEKALQLVEVLASSREPMRLGDLAAACGMMKQISSVYGAVVAAIQEGTL